MGVIQLVNVQVLPYGVIQPKNTELPEILQENHGTIPFPFCCL